MAEQKGVYKENYRDSKILSKFLNYKQYYYFSFLT